MENVDDPPELADQSNSSNPPDFTGGVEFAAEATFAQPEMNNEQRRHRFLLLTSDEVTRSPAPLVTWLVLSHLHKSQA